MLSPWLNAYAIHFGRGSRVPQQLHPAEEYRPLLLGTETRCDLPLDKSVYPCVWAHLHWPNPKSQAWAACEYWPATLTLIRAYHILIDSRKCTIDRMKFSGLEASPNASPSHIRHARNITHHHLRWYCFGRLCVWLLCQQYREYRPCGFHRSLRIRLPSVRTLR